MDKTIEDLTTRRSVRRFAKKEVSREILETIVDAGLSAPSAHGKRPWLIAVIEDKGTRVRVAEKMQWFAPTVEAPVAILVCGNPDECVQREYWTVDCAALSENILIAARALGLGTTWCGISPAESNVEAIRSVLDIPSPFVPFSMIALGYPESEAVFHERNKTGDEKRVTWNPDWLRKA